MPVTARTLPTHCRSRPRHNHESSQAQHIHELIASLRLAQARERGELVRRAALALGKTPKTVYRMLKAADGMPGANPARMLVRLLWMPLWP